jgi:hypothetical protein
MKPDSFNRLDHEQLQELFGRMAEIEDESPPISNAYEASYRSFQAGAIQMQ